MNSTQRQPLDNRGLFTLIGIVVIVALLITTFQVRSNAGTTTIINITVTPAVLPANNVSGALPAMPDFTKLVNASNLPSDLKQALSNTQLTNGQLSVAPTAVAPFVQPPLPTEDGASYNVVVQDHPQFGRIVLVENTWFQCRKLTPDNQFGTAYPTAGLMYTDNTDTAKWPTLRPSAQRIIEDTCRK
jgi:hypothetical protein